MSDGTRKNKERPKKPDEAEKPKSQTMQFLNSPFGIFLLGLIFVSVIGGGFQVWRDQLKEEDARREKPKKLLMGADSIYIGRMAYGANDYFQPSQPEFANQSWGGIIGQLEAFGIPADAAPAKHAVDTLMNGPYAGQDSIKRGYFAPGVLEEQSKVLHLYCDAASKKILDTSIWRAFSR